MIRLYSILSGVILGLLLLAQSTISAQEPLRFLTDSLEPETGNVSLIWVDVEQQDHQPLVSFNAPSFCRVHFTADGRFFYFEPAAFDSYSLYQVNLETGASAPLELAIQQNWSCPTPNPQGHSMAWLHPVETQTEIIVTDALGENPIVLATSEGISDPLWSPDGEILIYTTANGTARPLFAHGEAQHAFWQDEVGLPVDYIWLPDSSALLVAYYTDAALILGRLERNCVLAETCLPTELASFSVRASLILTEAINSAYAVVIQEDTSASGELTSDLYRVDVVLGGAERLTNTPQLTKTSAILDGEQVYFVGAIFDLATFQVTESAIYRLDSLSLALSVVYQAEGYYPVQILKLE